MYSNTSNGISRQSRKARREAGGAITATGMIALYRVAITRFRSSNLDVTGDDSELKAEVVVTARDGFFVRNELGANECAGMDFSTRLEAPRQEKF